MHRNANLARGNTNTTDSFAYFILIRTNVVVFLILVYDRTSLGNLCREMKLFLLCTCLSIFDNRRGNKFNLIQSLLLQVSTHQNETIMIVFSNIIEFKYIDVCVPISKNRFTYCTNYYHKYSHAYRVCKLILINRIH